jgi:hypothetical protein
MQIQAIREAWVGARKKILSSLVDLLHGHLDYIWTELFNKDTFPDPITLIGLSKGVWNNPDHRYQGTEVYYASAVNDSSETNGVCGGASSDAPCHLKVWYGTP